MSAAFDILDHATLLHNLEHTFGLPGIVISWIRSYITNHSSFVKIDSSSSPSTTISTGVPQGSVLGPLLFVLFISPVANVINPDLSETTNLVCFHQYADDTQLYIGTNSSTLVHQVASIESCTQRIHNWLLNNGLHLNPSKSEAIAFFNPRFKHLEALNPLNPFQLPVHPSGSNHQSKIWVFILTLECLLTNRFPRHARHLTFTFVHFVTFDLPSPLRLRPVASLKRAGGGGHR